MRKSLNRIAAAVTAVATVGTMLLTVAPASAAQLVDLKDTQSRLKAATASSHTVTYTRPAGTFSGTIIILFPADGFVVPTSTSGFTTTCTGATLTGGNSTDAATDTIVVYTNGPGCSGAGTVSIATTAGGNNITNPSAASYTIKVFECAPTDDCTSEANAIANADNMSTLSVSIVDDDQVSVTASVDPSITFDIDVAFAGDTCSTTETATPYTVALGTITTADSKVSGTTDSVNYICLDLDTNAGGGAVITVKNANGANGLASTSVSADDIDSSTGTIANGTENYGICVTTTSDVGVGAFTEASPFDNADCTANEQTPAVGGLDGTSQNLVNTGSAGIATGRVTITVAAAISSLTEAHTDYTDTLTFIATGTF